MRLKEAAAPYHPHSCDVNFKSQNATEAIVFLTVTFLDTTENEVVQWDDNCDFEKALQKMIDHLSIAESYRLTPTEGGEIC